MKTLSGALPTYQKLFGYELISPPIEDRIQKVAVCFLRRGEGDPRLELVAPLGKDSPIRETLKRGGGTYHICYEVPELAHAIDHLVSYNSILLREPLPAIAFGLRLVAWLFTEGHLLVELLEAEQGSSGLS